MSPPVALITGGSSGIGLALTKHLLSLGWAVTIADINPPPASPPLPKTATYTPTDISSYTSQATTFASTHTRHGRLDFCALNAGIDDRDDIFGSLPPPTSPAPPPKKPNMHPVAVNLTGTYYGLKLAAYYMTRDSSAAGKPRPGGKIAITASAAGLRPLAVVPQYSMTKHGLVGLVRSVGPGAAAVDIRVNAVCPALVATGLAPKGLMESFDARLVTPMETILRCFEEVGRFGEVGGEGWVGSGRWGEVVEGTLGELVWHEAAVEERGYRDEKGMEAWRRAYEERNRGFAMRDWEAEEQGGSAEGKEGM